MVLCLFERARVEPLPCVQTAKSATGQFTATTTTTTAWVFNTNEKMTAVLSETLKAAATRGYTDDVKLGITSSNLNLTDELGNTLLHLSAAAGHKEVVQLLLAQKDIKPSLSIKNHIGDTPLHKASFRGNVEIVQLLLKAGCDKTAKNRNNKTPLDLARQDDVKDAIAPEESFDENAPMEPDDE